MGLIGAYKEGLSVGEMAGRQVWYVKMKKGGWVAGFGSLRIVLGV